MSGDLLFGRYSFSADHLGACAKSGCKKQCKKQCEFHSSSLVALSFAKPFFYLTRFGSLFQHRLQRFIDVIGHYFLALGVGVNAVGLVELGI